MAPTPTTCCPFPTPGRRSPAPWTGESAQVQDYLEIPLIVENVSSYAEFHASEMTEWEFSPKWSSGPTAASSWTLTTFTSPAKTTISIRTNISTTFPHDRVGQMHIAGHTKYENTSSTRTTIRCWTRCGKCTPMHPQMRADFTCWNGTPISHRWKKFIAEALKANRFRSMNSGTQMILPARTSKPVAEVGLGYNLPNSKESCSPRFCEDMICHLIKIIRGDEPFTRQPAFPHFG